MFSFIKLSTKFINLNQVVKVETRLEPDTKKTASDLCVVYFADGFQETFDGNDAVQILGTVKLYSHTQKIV